MPRVLTARFMHETNTFSRVKTHDDRTGLACLPLFSALAEFERPVRADTAAACRARDHDADGGLWGPLPDSHLRNR